MQESELPLLSPTARMMRIPGGAFRMGSADFYPEERPVHDVTVDGFWMDRDEVTNDQFARFVAETGYVTVAERPLKPEDFPGAPREPRRGFDGLPEANRTRRSSQLRQLVGVGAGRELAPSQGS